MSLRGPTCGSISLLSGTLASDGAGSNSSIISLVQAWQTCPSHNRTMTSLPPGTATIKAEYVQRCISVIIITRFLLSNASRPAVDDDAAEGSTSTHTGTIDPIADTDASPGGRKKLIRQQKKAHRGANKGRRFGKVRDELELCWRVANGTLCEQGSQYVLLHLTRISLTCV